jgi:peroxiredoxin Q/BCP
MIRSLQKGPLSPGTPAPDFTLPDAQGQPVHLASLQGRAVVLIFYPGNDTPLCTRQLCQLRDHWTQLQQAGAHAFGINGLGSAGIRRFAEKFDFPFPLLFDQGWKVTRAYRCGWLIALRTVYVIAPDGRIAYARRGFPSYEEILNALRCS